MSLRIFTGIFSTFFGTLPCSTFWAIGIFTDVTQAVCMYTSFGIRVVTAQIVERMFLARPTDRQETMVCWKVSRLDVPRDRERPC